MMLVLNCSAAPPTRVRSTLQDKEAAAASTRRDRQQLPDRKTLEAMQLTKRTQVFSGAMSLSLPFSNRNPVFKICICVWLCWVIVALLRLSLGSVSRGLLLLMVRGLLSAVRSSSCCGARAQ